MALTFVMVKKRFNGGADWHSDVRRVPDELSALAIT
jgi:hypothetical protein